MQREVPGRGCCADQHEQEKVPHRDQQRCRQQDRNGAAPGENGERGDVRAVLDSMAKEGTLNPDWSSRTIEVMNKADLLGGIGKVSLRPGMVAVSALTGEGLPDLKKAIDSRLGEGMVVVGYDIPTSDGAQLAWLYEHGEIVGRQDGESAIHVTVRLRPQDRARFEQQASPPH